MISIYKTTLRLFITLIIACFSTGLLPTMAAHATKPVNNAGDIKVREVGAADEIPQNDPHLDSCSVVVEFYNFNNTSDEQATVSFTSQAPTKDAVIHVSGGSLTPTIPGDGDADGEGNNDADGAFTYTLSFVGQPAAQGYHVDLDVDVTNTNGGLKQKTFWMPASCQEKTVVTAEAPTADDFCGTSDDSYTIPDVTGVIYSVNGVPTTAGTYTATGHVVITATADDGYELADEVNEWAFDFSDEACEEGEAIISVTVECGPGGLVVTVINSGDLAGSAVVNGVIVNVAADSTQQLTLALDSGFQLHLVVTVDGRIIICETVTCQPGMGGGGGETPVPPAPTPTPVTPPASVVASITAVPTSLPSTGAQFNYLSLLLVMSIAYGAIYFGRQRLLAARQF